MNYIYPTLVINLSRMLHGQSLQLHNFIFALKISFIAMSTFCYNLLARNTIVSTPKRTDRGFSQPNKRILRML